MFMSSSTARPVKSESGCLGSIPFSPLSAARHRICFSSSVPGYWASICRPVSFQTEKGKTLRYCVAVDLSHLIIAEAKSCEARATAIISASPSTPSMHPFTIMRQAFFSVVVNQVGGLPSGFLLTGSFSRSLNRPGFTLSAPLSFKMLVGVRGLTIILHYADKKIKWAARCTFTHPVEISPALPIKNAQRA